MNRSGNWLRLQRAALCAAVVVACAGAAFAQAGPPVVVVETGSFPNYPVELEAVDVGGRTYEFTRGRPGQSLASFEAREDWLRQFAFRIRNKSDKAVVHIILHGSVGTGEEGDIPLGIETIYGRELDESAYTGRAPRGEPRRLAPGETAEVRLSADEYEQVVRFAATKQRTPADFRKLHVNLREAFFEDGTVWSTGRLFRIDPADPRKWTALDGRPPTGSVATPELKPGERLIEFDPRRAGNKKESDALSLTGITAGGQSVMPGRPFVAAGADWLRGLTVRVRNDSAKPINTIRITFTLPEARYRSGGIAFKFSFDATRPGKDGAPAPAPLQPGAELEMGFSNDDYETQRTFAVTRSGLTDFTHVRVGTASVGFADGTRATVLALMRKPAEGGGAK